MWTPLLTGGAVVVAPPGEIDGDVLRTVIGAHGVTALLLTAGVFRLVARESPECLAGLREIWSGGDVVPAAEGAAACSTPARASPWCGMPTVRRRSR